YQIIQAPGYVTILVEMIHDARIIPLDNGSHLPSPVRQWMGDSRGHWEADTLVVETTNFTNKTNFRGARREYASDRALHAHGCEHDCLRIQGERPIQFHQAVDRSNSHEKNCGSAPRVRLPRRQLRDGRDARWCSRGGEEGC